MRLVVAVVAIALTIATGSLALATQTPDPRAGHGSANGGCHQGQAPSSGAYRERPPEGFLRYQSRPVVIGCGRLLSGRRFELIGYRLGTRKRNSRGRSALCIDVHYPQSGESSGCGSSRVQGRGAIDATGVTRAAGKSVTVTGATRGDVAGVSVRYELRGRMRKRRAALVIVRDPDLLRAVEVKKPFGLYLAEVPPKARAVSAQARGTKGDVIGVAYFMGFGGPVAEGRRCHGRPRVTDLRLSAPARAGQRTPVKFAARYPGGYIDSAEVRANRAVVHADLVVPKTRRDGSRRNITLPLRLERRGTVRVDVTVEGLPLASKRCGEDGQLRKSAPSTLAVRVR